MASLSIDAEEATQNGLDMVYSKTIQIQGEPEPLYEVHSQTAEDGDRAWRINNPANINDLPNHEFVGQIGEHTADGSTLAVFSSMDAGKDAAYNNIFDDDHEDMTVEERVKAWPGYEDIPGGLTAEEQEDNYWDNAKAVIDSALWSVLMSTINTSTYTTDTADKTEVYSGILNAENGWGENATPSGSDVGTVSSPPSIAYTPLVLDLDGDGVQTISIDEGVKFDLDDDHKKEDTGWIEKEDGLLALDLNGDGKINKGSELFGSETLIDGIKAGDGYIALRQYDTNLDNVIDSADEIFDDLLIWIDSNSNGVSSKHELHTLSELGIASISLESHLDFVAQNGNFLVKQGEFTYENGSTGEMADVHFQTIGVNIDQEISLIGISSDQGLFG